MANEAPQFVEVLFRAMGDIDLVYRSKEPLPASVALCAMSVNYTLLKCLQQCGWDVYYDTVLERIALVQTHEKKEQWRGNHPA